MHLFLFHSTVTAVGDADGFLQAVNVGYLKRCAAQAIGYGVKSDRQIIYQDGSYFEVRCSATFLRASMPYATRCLPHHPDVTTVD